MNYSITDEVSAGPLVCVRLLVWSGGCSRELQECERRRRPTMLKEPLKSCTQAPSMVCCGRTSPLNRRHNRIHNLNWHMSHRHFTGQRARLTWSFSRFSDSTRPTRRCLENEWVTQSGNGRGKWLGFVNLAQQNHSKRGGPQKQRERPREHAE